MNPAHAKLRLIILSSAVAFVLIVGAVMLRNARMSQVASAPAPVPIPWAVSTVAVTRGTVTRGFPALATVATAHDITISPQISGTILEMGPREGVSVKPGDLLARIDVRELDSQVEALKAQLNAAQAEAHRQANEAQRERQLLDEGGSSAAEVERWSTGQKAAEEEARALEEQIHAVEIRRGYGRITLPVEGIIAARLAEPGDVAMPGTPIYRITTTRGARVIVRLPLEVRQQVKTGCPLELQHGDEVLTVHVSRVRPSVDPAALGTVEADVAEAPFGLPSGARLSARVICRVEQDALIVPHDAVLQDTGGVTGRVFRVTGDAARHQIQIVPVTVSLVGREGIAVEGDLGPGNEVVVGHESLLIKLQDGDPVNATLMERRP